MVFSPHIVAALFKFFRHLSIVICKFNAVFAKENCFHLTLPWQLLGC